MDGMDWSIVIVVLAVTMLALFDMNAPRPSDGFFVR